MLITICRRQAFQFTIIATVSRRLFDRISNFRPIFWVFGGLYHSIICLNLYSIILLNIYSNIYLIILLNIYSTIYLIIKLNSWVNIYSSFSLSAHSINRRTSSVFGCPSFFAFADRRSFRALEISTFSLIRSSLFSKSDQKSLAFVLAFSLCIFVGGLVGLLFGVGSSLTFNLDAALKMSSNLLSDIIFQLLP